MEGLRAQVTVGKAFSLYLPFDVAKIDDDQRMVYGYATTEATDAEGEIITKAAIEGALPDYMKFANLREMHQLSAVGVVPEADLDKKGLYIGAKVVDDVAWKKVKEKVYKGFSIGGRALSREGNKITGLELIEISLVDRPCNPEALIDSFKALGLGDPSNEPFEVKQFWDCGCPSHRHVAKAAAMDCVKAQTEEHGEGSIYLMRTMRTEVASIIDKLPKDGLTACINRAALAVGGEAPPSKDLDESELKGAVEKVKESKVEFYADSGLQEDQKQRLPIRSLDGEYHPNMVRAAWMYLQYNSGKYTPANLAVVKEKVAAAWKACINEDGPPSASGAKQDTTAKGVKMNKLLEPLGKADAKSGFNKGMYAVQCAVALLESLNYLQERLAKEAAVEGDNSPMPERFKALMATTAELVKELLAEEVDEMLNDKEASDMGESSYFGYADKLIELSKTLKVGKQIAKFIVEAVGDKTDKLMAARLLALAEKLEKGDEYNWNNKTEFQWNDSWTKKAEVVQHIHDAAVEKGATCKASDPPPVEDEEDEEEEVEEEKKSKKKKADTTDKKAVVDVGDTVAKAVGEAVGKALGDLDAKVEKAVETVLDKLLPATRNPPSPKGGKTAVVDKAADVDIDPEDKKQKVEEPGDVLRGIHQRPNFFTHR